MFQKECDAGKLPACVALAENLLSGQGVDVDRAKALALLKKACDGKIESACAKLKSLK
jgi:TPR repeat protein